MAVGESIGYSYTGSVIGVTIKKAGTYKLEVWGAEGGHYLAADTYTGKGGYSYGAISLTSGTKLYVVVGGAGKFGTNPTPGGYNGGGRGAAGSDWTLGGSGGSGGGATHIATRTGVLSSLSAYQSSVLIVAGGGAGAYDRPDTYSSTSASGGNGGGFTGGNGGDTYMGLDTYYKKTYNVKGSGGGTQTSGGVARDSSFSSYVDPGAFGQGGGDGTAFSQTYYYEHHSGGGGGFYGGASGVNYTPSREAGSPGGGGSGYIGNSALTSKGMYMYNGGTGCTSSTTTATKTTCTSSTGAHVANAANTGNGYAKITRQS